MSPSDGATEVKRLLKETELLLQQAQTADERSESHTLTYICCVCHLVGIVHSIKLVVHLITYPGYGDMFEDRCVVCHSVGTVDSRKLLCRVLETSGWVITKLEINIQR